MEKQTLNHRPIISYKDIPLSSYYCKLINYSLKNDIVSGIFIAGLLSTILAVEILSFQFGTLTAKFYEILPKRSSSELSQIVMRFCTFVFMMAIGKGCLMGTKALLARGMRKNLTHHFHSKYLHLSGLKATSLDNVILDAPDQRITEDVDRFSKGVLNIFEILFISPILIIFYTVQVYEKLSLPSLTLIYTHFLVSFFILRLAMRRLKNLTVKLEEREASFRSEHVNIKVNSESLLMINSQNLLERIKVNLNNQLLKLLFTAKQLILTESTVEVGKNFFSYSGALLNFLLMAGEMTWGRWRDQTDPTKIANMISLTSFLSLYLIFQLSKLTSAIDLLGILNGQVQRLGQFLDVLENNSDSNQDSNTESDDSGSLHDFKIVMKNLDNQNIIFTINKGENSLISGPNGVGKTSILRYLSGIWELPVDGQIIIKLNNDTIMQSALNTNIAGRPFLMTCPQNFVLFSGSLYDLLGLKIDDKENLEFTDEESAITKTSDEKINQVLKIAGLPVEKLEPFNLVRSLTTWQTILTPGQHQRLSLSRGLLHRPHLLALDETCIAIGKKETVEILKVFEKLNITVILIDPTCDNDDYEFFQQKHQMSF